MWTGGLRNWEDSGIVTVYGGSTVRTEPGNKAVTDFANTRMRALSR